MSDINDLVSHIVSLGVGTICAGNGTIVHYGPTMPPNRPGIVFIPNDIHDEEAECLLREALLIAPTMVGNSKNRHKAEVVPSEE